ncbi:hypothetical protein TNCV_3316431 [Trichonephila clavipes]|nr:hypothetical protein TNCV_3316431 [Trichonephila clavipes]
MDFVSMVLQKDLDEMYPLYMIVGSSGQGMVLSKEDGVPGGYVAQPREKTGVFCICLGCILHLQQKFRLQLLP